MINQFSSDLIHKAADIWTVCTAHPCTLVYTPHLYSYNSSTLSITIFLAGVQTSLPCNLRPRILQTAKINFSQVTTRFMIFLTVNVTSHINELYHTSWVCVMCEGGCLHTCVCVCVYLHRCSGWTALWGAHCCQIFKEVLGHSY